MTRWSVEERGGKVIVSRDRQTKTFDDIDAALRYIREHRRTTDRVVKLDEDGYRVPLTRRRWRQRGLDL